MSAPIQLGSYRCRGITMEWLHHFMIRFARDQYGWDGELTPSWFLVTPGVAISVFITPWENEDEKVQSIAAMRAAMTDLGTTLYSQASEVWMAWYDDDEINQPDRARPEDRADRQEALFITTHATDDFRMSRCRILSHRPPGLGEIEHLKRSNSFGGRMSNLLNEA